MDCPLWSSEEVGSWQRGQDAVVVGGAECMWGTVGLPRGSQLKESDEALAAV